MEIIKKPEESKVKKNKKELYENKKIEILDYIIKEMIPLCNQEIESVEAILRFDRITRTDLVRFIKRDLNYYYKNRKKQLPDPFCTQLFYPENDENYNSTTDIAFRIYKDNGTKKKVYLDGLEKTRIQLQIKKEINFIEFLHSGINRNELCEFCNYWINTKNKSSRKNCKKHTKLNNSKRSFCKFFKENKKERKKIKKFGIKEM